MNSKDKVKTADFFAANPVFSLEEATLQLQVPRGRIGAVDRLKYYLKTGRLMLVTREVYAVVPHSVSAIGFIPDPFLVAVAMRKDAVFSHHTALELLGAAHSTWNRLTLYTGERRRPLDLKNGSITFLSDPDTFSSNNNYRYYGTKKVERRGRLLVVTGPERTLVEGFRRIAYSGGVEELVTSASGFPIVDIEMLNIILHRYNSKILWAATGWFLERYRSVFHVEDSVLYEMEKHRPLSPCYIERGRRGGILVPRWNLILPDVIAKRNNGDEP